MTPPHKNFKKLKLKSPTVRGQSYKNALALLCSHIPTFLLSLPYAPHPGPRHNLLPRLCGATGEGVRETSERGQRRTLQQAESPHSPPVAPLSVPPFPAPAPWKVTNLSTLKVMGFTTLGVKFVFEKRLSREHKPLLPPRKAHSSALPT